MKKILIPVMLLVSLCGYAQKNFSGSLLWKISGNGLASPSYMLGTLHLKPASFFDAIPGAKEALASCSQVAGEILSTEMAAAAQQMQMHMMMKPDTTYAMLYSEADYRLVSEKLTALLGAGLDQVAALKPAALDMVVSLTNMTRNFPDLDQSNLLDEYIQKEGLRQQKKVMALEGVDHQLYVLLDSKSLKRQAELLLCGLQHNDHAIESADRMLKMYDQGDLNGLYAMLSDTPCPPTKAEMDILNKDRNDAWMKKLPEIMKAGPTFVAVGALHLAGEEGLLNQLKKAGYKVEAVK